MKNALFTLSALSLVAIPSLGFSRIYVSEETDSQRTQSASTRLERWNSLTEEEKASIKNGYSVQPSALTPEELAAKEQEMQLKREAFQTRISSTISNQRASRVTYGVGKDIQLRFLEAGVQMPANWGEMTMADRVAFAEANGMTMENAPQNSANPVSISSKAQRGGRSFSRGFAKQSLIGEQRQKSSSNKLTRVGKWDFKGTVSQ
ncbi:hypothetical protein K9L27_01110 [Candidatus Gracilibacteria bacterium]|nr:hypothetical protein [Candidatus Gracilibacteria bacterium]